MGSEDDHRSRLADLLNTSTPFAPTSDEDIGKRLTTGNERASAAPESEDPDQGGSAKEQESLSLPEPERPRPDRGSPPPPPDPLSALAGLNGLIAEIESFGSSLQAALRPASEHTGEDGTGTVSVTLGTDGFPDRLTFRRPWRKRLSTETFDQAVLEALSNALTARVSESVSGLEGMEMTPGSPKAPGRPASVPGRRPSIDPEAALRQVNLLAAEFSAALSEVEREIDQAARDEPPGTTVQSASRRVSLTVVGEAVTEVITQDGWLRNADESRISAEFETAFAAAREVLGTQSEFEPASTPGIARIQRIAQEARDLTPGVFDSPEEGGR